ncbi:hypothetical protein C5O80_12480 [Burkholderia sp. SRS-46]|nr:hypothetical protein C5O80_12480 [Burkholderia sp. SRS-46]
MIVFSIRGFKDTAQSGQEMARLIEVLIDAITPASTRRKSPRRQTRHAPFARPRQTLTAPPSD